MGLVVVRVKGYQRTAPIQHNGENDAGDRADEPRRERWPTPPNGRNIDTKKPPFQTPFLKKQRFRQF